MSDQPVIPSRPQRKQPVAEDSNAASLPLIPPRPASKRTERPIPSADYPHSPLNDPYGMSRKRSMEPVRLPSVQKLPMSGEEGSEYADIQYQPQILVSSLGADAAAQTRQVSQDLPIHAPKPSLPTTSATAQVQAVTKTDSSVPGTPGIVRPPSQDGENTGRTRSRASYSRPDSAASGERRRSVYGENLDHGPAELGMRVPINPLLGDVQAPSPGPGLSPHPTGGPGADPKARRHSTKPGREVHLPPGSYGLHGHGLIPDKFEKDWYAKHPEMLEHEEGHGHGVYESIGSGRGSFAMSSEDLNQIVRSTASRGHGFGTSGNVVSYPDEQIGYMASEQYQSRHQTPSGTPTVPRTPSMADPRIQSPLRKANFPGSAGVNDSDVDAVHIGAPIRKFNKVTGGQGSINDREDVKPYVSHSTDGNDEHEYRVPILADDEVAKEPANEYQQPAVSPVQQRRGSAYDEHGNEVARPSSRPSSIYNLHSASTSLSRFHSHHDDRDHLHTPLEDVEEYEPLFPESEDKQKAVTAADRFKQRPDISKHRFPSQDVWEDTPDSAMYEATVSTPDLPHPEKLEKETSSVPSSSTFETPETEAARKGEATEEEKKKLIPAEVRLAKSKFAPHLRDDMPTRPGMQPRFPSQDVWEDSPDSQSLFAEVNSPEPEVQQEPVVPQRPAKSRLGEGASSAQIAPSVQPQTSESPEKIVHAVPPFGAKLTEIASPPTEETSPTELRKVPSIPDRPKPQVPARPKKVEADAAAPPEDSSVDKDVSSPALNKAKPQVPARPAGSKIANLRSSFMNDLNAKLGMGPPKEKEPEPIVEAEEPKPLEDARKGRARGPQRRAPAKSPAAGASSLSSAVCQPQSLWHIDDEGLLNVPAAHTESHASKSVTEAADYPASESVETSSKVGIEAAKRPDDAPAPLAPSLATNTAGEYVDPVSGSA